MKQSSITPRAPDTHPALRRLLRKSDLEPIYNLKLVLREIRDYCAGNVTGITRDETIAQNLLRLLICKLLDEQEKAPDEAVDLARRPDEDGEELARRVHHTFARAKIRFNDLFAPEETIALAPTELAWVISQLEAFSLLDADRDVIGDAFEQVIGTAFRGGEGQFFTPRNVVQMMIDVLAPTSGEHILDPACGSGGFLAYVLRYLLQRRADNYFIAGIDKDHFLARLAKIYLMLIGEREYSIFCENSLESPEKWKQETRAAIQFESFDVILTNPPFGAKIPVMGDGLLRQYELGHRWTEHQGKWYRHTTLMDKQPPQILFIERCLQLLKPGGRMGIVLPEGIFGNPSDRYVWEFIQQHASVMGVVGLSQETFQPSTHTKTSVLFLEKRLGSPRLIFMAIAYNVGHNKNGKETFKRNLDGSFVLDAQGNKILDDDLPAIAQNFRAHLEGALIENTHLGFTLDRAAVEDHIFIPEYYNPEIQRELQALADSGKYRLVAVGELVRAGLIEIRRGNEIGSEFYGTGDIPFVRTTDIVNWEIKMDPVKAVSEECYLQYRELQDVRVNDILFVNDGTFLIGRTALVTRLDTRIVIQSHLRKIRGRAPAKLDPYYLFYLLNTKIVRKQIDSKTFVQATIATIGNRLLQVILPMLIDPRAAAEIAREVQDILERKTQLRERSRALVEQEI